MIAIQAPDKCNSLHLPKHAMHNNRCECRGNARRMAQNDVTRLTGRRGQVNLPSTTDHGNIGTCPYFFDFGGA